MVYLFLTNQVKPNEDSYTFNSNCYIHFFN